jgi:DNA-binding XRE family transcriptional regulator
MPDNTSTVASPAPLTVDTAAPVLEGLLSPPKAKKEAASAKDKAEPTDKELETPDEGAESEVEQHEQLDESEVAAEDEPEKETPEAEEEEVEEPLEPRKIKVRKEDGTEEEVSEKELQDSYLRTADYTRKSQANADARKKFESEEVPALRAERVQLADGLKNIEEALRAISPQEPDWDKIRIENPEQFANARAEWQLTQERLGQVQEARKKADAQVEKDRTSQLTEYATAERSKLLEKIPAWKDEKVATKEKEAIAEYALLMGYDANDLKNVFDHRLMLILRDAMNGKKAAEKKPAIKQRIETIRAATPGPTDTNRPKVQEVMKLRQKLAKSGKVEDAADIFDIMFAEDAKAKAKAAR